MTKLTTKQKTVLEIIKKNGGIEGNLKTLKALELKGFIKNITLSHTQFYGNTAIRTYSANVL